MNSRRIGLVSALLLSGCALFQTKPTAPETPVKQPDPIVIEKPVVKDTACDWDFPIVVTDGFIALLQDPASKAALDPVAAQILKHNKIGAEKCNWKPVVKKG